MREYIRAGNRRWEVTPPGKLRKKLPRSWRNEKTLPSRGNSQQDNKSLKNLMHSKNRTRYEIRFENYKNDNNLLTTQEFSKILTHRAVMAALTFLIKLMLPRFPERLASISRKPRITRADMSISAETHTRKAVEKDTGETREKDTGKTREKDTWETREIAHLRNMRETHLRNHERNYTGETWEKHTGEAREKHVGEAL